MSKADLIIDNPHSYKLADMYDYAKDIESAAFTDAQRIGTARELCKSMRESFEAIGVNTGMTSVESVVSAFHNIEAILTGKDQ